MVNYLLKIRSANLSTTNTLMMYWRQHIEHLILIHLDITKYLQIWFQVCTLDSWNYNFSREK
jgi:hypothetical protein